MANQEIQREKSMCKLFKRGQEITLDSMLLISYSIMFFIYLLFILVTSSILIIMGYFISLKKFFDINEKIEEKA